MRNFPFEDLLDIKVVRILKVLAKEKTQLFHLQKISAESKVPIASSFRIVSKLAKLGYIDVVIVGKLKLYRISQNKKTKMLEFEDLLDKKVVRILKVLAKEKTQLFHLQKISAESKVPIASSFRIVSKLAKLSYVDVVTVGKLKLYRISQNKKTKMLENV